MKSDFEMPSSLKQTFLISAHRNSWFHSDLIRSRTQTRTVESSHSTTRHSDTPFGLQRVHVDLSFSARLFFTIYKATISTSLTRQTDGTA
jgi:hypothetical protein